MQLQGIGGTTPARVAGRKLRQQSLLPALLDPMPPPPTPHAVSPDPLPACPTPTPGERTAQDSVAAPTAAQLPQGPQPAPEPQSTPNAAVQLLHTLQPATAEPCGTPAPSLGHPPSAAAAAAAAFHTPFHMPAAASQTVQPGLCAVLPLAAGPTPAPAQLQHMPCSTHASTHPCTGTLQQRPSAGSTGTAAACWDLLYKVPRSQQLLPGADQTPGSSAPQQPRSSQSAPASWPLAVRQNGETRGMASASELQHALPPRTPLQLSSHLASRASSQHGGKLPLPIDTQSQQPGLGAGSMLPAAVAAASPAEQGYGAEQTAYEAQRQGHRSAAGVAGALGTAGFPHAIAGPQILASAGPGSPQPPAAAAEHADAAGAAQDDPDYDPEG